jgi:hypothetical protein
MWENYSRVAAVQNGDRARSTLSRHTLGSKADSHCFAAMVCLNVHQPDESTTQASEQSFLP